MRSPELWRLRKDDHCSSLTTISWVRIDGGGDREHVAFNLVEADLIATGPTLIPRHVDLVCDLIAIQHVSA